MLVGQERWDKIKELQNEGKTYAEIAPIIGLGSGKAVSVWVARNRSKYDKSPVDTKNKAPISRSKVKKPNKNRVTNIREDETEPEAFKMGEDFDVSQFDNDDIQTFLTSILNMCDVDVTKFHVHKDEENERWTVGILAELRSRNKTIFPYTVRIRTTAAIGKSLPALVNQDELDRKKLIANAIKSAAQEAEIMSVAMNQNINKNKKEKTSN